MTHVLLLSYFFPPIGMAGAARAYALFRYLPEFGYRPHVITVKDIVYPAFDDTMLTGDDSQHITRTGSLDPSRLLRIAGRRRLAPGLARGRGAGWITPDYKRLWAPFAKRAAERFFKTHTCPLMITTSPPPSTHQIGLELKARYAVKWVADFRDVWFTRPIEEVYRSERQKEKCRSLLTQVQAHADDIVAVNKSVAAYVGARAVISNGADPETFVEWDRSARSDGVYHIGYMGTTEDERAANVFVTALKDALDVTGVKPDDCRVVYVGAVDETTLQREFLQAGLIRSLEIQQYRSRREAVAALRDVDLLLVTVSDERLTHVTTSKVFDYLVSGKRICALVPENGELAALLQEEGECVFSPNNTEALKEFLVTELERKRSNSEMYRVAGETLNRRREKYSWRALAGQMARRLDGLM